MIVWGGSDGSYSGFLNSGGIYDPATNAWASTSTVGAPIGRAEATAVWTGSKVIVWGGSDFATSTYYATGGVYDPATDTWAPTSTVGAPAARRGHTAVWTGSRMIVFGGYGSGGIAVNTGGSYDPGTDSWSGLSTSGVPARSQHTAVWTGTRMLVWGGGGPYGAVIAGGAYDPATNTWAAMTTTGAPTPRGSHKAVWTGRRMIIWGGYWNGAIGTGGVYDAAVDTWKQTTTLGEPSPRWDHTAVWTGSRMVVWGGYGAGHFANSGGIYDPGFAWLHLRKGGAGAGTVQSVPAGISCGASCLSASAEFLAGTLVELTATADADSIFTGWTGACTGASVACVVPLESSAVVTASFMPKALAARLSVLKAGTGAGSVVSDPPGISCADDCPGASAYFPPGTVVTLQADAAVGSVLGGWRGAGCGATASSCPVAMDSDKGVLPTFDAILTVGSWTPTSTSGAPVPRLGHSAVWTGSKMVVWGGSENTWGSLATGGVYDPASDTWTDTSTVAAPSARGNHTALWTGTRMIVWGGFGSALQVADGGLYDPSTDSWTTPSTAGAPIARSHHKAVWTGSKMIVWGGLGPTSVFNSGGIYDPTTDTWAATSLIDAPAPRHDFVAVWTGSRMIVWGGYAADGTPLGSGGVYDPGTDAWTPTSAQGAPSPRVAHSGVWTGSRMIVWGGISGAEYLGTGAAYDPTTDTWTPVSASGAPDARGVREAVWTGSRMIVWGGAGAGGWNANGGLYDPATDTWTAMSTAAAPSARNGLSALWAGSRMVVWGGGEIPSPCVNTGGLYDPSGEHGLGMDVVAAVRGVWPAVAAPGSAVTVQYEVANLGNVPAGTSTLDLWLSPDDTLEPATDVRLTPVGLDVAPLAAGQSVTAAATVTIPGGTAMKIWRLIARADALDTVAESLETNNTGSRAFRVDRRAAVDFNADGQADLLWHHQVSGDLYTWQLQGTVTAAGAYLTPKSFADTRWQIRGLADFDRDGNVDVLWHHQVSGDLYIWFLGGTVTVRGSYLTPQSFADTRWQIRGVSDFDGDGKPDLLWHHQVTGDLYIWFLDGTVTVRGSYLTPPTFADTRWQIRGISDFNGDGRADVLWHHQGNGELYVWYLHATTTVAGSYLTPRSFADTRWKIVLVADFDGDGHKDLLWHHQQTGELYVWFLEGTVTVDGTYLDPARFSDVNWKVVPR